MTHAPKKIAVIGGGVGAITSVYALTQLPNWQEKYDITLYQLGWRLGGKGASGRNMEKGGRIEEHGLHIWAGFYENGFRLMRDCYDQLNTLGLRDPDAPLGTLETAFSGLNHFMLAEEIPTKTGTEIHPWLIDFFPNSDKPGTGGVIPTPFAYFEMFVEFLASLLKNTVKDVPRAFENVSLPQELHHIFDRHGASKNGQTPLNHLHDYVKVLPKNAFDHTPEQTGTLHTLASNAQTWLQSQDYDSIIQNDDLRRLYYMMDLSIAFFKGAIDNGVFRHGFDPLDKWEISEWLLMYGASHNAVYSAIFRGCYDYVFGYPGGMIDDRSVGAGTSIRGLLRLAFSYKGSLFFKMLAGMGDTIFGPYYQVLKHRGVKFKFFNAATNLVLNSDKTRIEAIDMVEQAKLEKAEYDPFVIVKDLPCWPSEPFWDQLVDGAKYKKKGVDFESEKDTPTGAKYQLKHGADFDEVILGASLGSMPYMAQELVAASDRWEKMMANVPTVATQAAQFWLNKPTTDTGWPELVAAHNTHTHDDLRTVMTSFSEPLDTWADMTDLIGREDWPGKQPKAIAYFCSPSHDADFDQPPLKDRVKDWANTELTRIWTKAKKGKGFDFSLLHDNKATTDKQRFDAQYFRTNYYGSERYVMSVPNSVQYRLAPDQSGFENLYLAGDWTRCGINAGCVEAASISGLMAARGLSGEDIQIVGEGDLAPDAGPTDRTLLASPYAQTAPWPITPFFGLGEMDGWFSFHAMDATFLQSQLPDGLYLQPQPLTSAGTHPVTVLANHQMNVRPSFLPQLLGFRPYFEAIVAINYVGVKDQEGSFSYLPKMYLNHCAPIFAGRLFYQFNKLRGNIQMDNSRYSVRSQNGAPIWSTKYAQPNTPRPLTDFDAVGRVRSLIEQPVVTPGRFSKWHYSAFDFGISSAYAAPVSANLTVESASFAGMPDGKYHCSPLENNNTGLPGAFRMWTSWTLTNPLDSKRIAKLVADQTHLP